MVAPSPTFARTSPAGSRSRTLRSSRQPSAPDQQLRDPMSPEEPRFRVVGPEDTIRRRPPGAAFLFVCLYAALFGGALWYLGARTGIWKKTARKVGATSPA